MTMKPPDAATNPRRLLQVTCTADLHQKIRIHCAKLDVPMAIWVREIIKKELGIV
jgi:hypothetical protein